MIIEHVHLKIREGESAAFEQAFQQAKDLIAPMQGLNAVQLIRQIENEHAYILMIFWDHLEDHSVGFRASEAYPKWAALLHPFYEHMPNVEYYQPCMMLRKK